MQQLLAIQIVIYMCILRCFKAHKLDNNIGLNPSQCAVAQVIFQDKTLNTDIWNDLKH